MPPSALFSRPLALTGLHCLIFLCIISLSSSLEVFSPPTLAGQPGRAELFIKRTWESEQGPFSDTPPQDSDIEEDGELAKVDTSTSDSPERLGIPGLGNPLPPLNSIVASVLSGSGVTVPIPGLPTPPVTSGDFFSSVISILSGAPTAVPTSHGGNGAALGGLLSALSQVTPVSVVPTASPGLLPAFDVLGGVAAALDNVLGSSEDNDSLGGGLLGQLSANIVAPLASIAADQASILSDPSAALDNLQSHVSSVMDSLPSAVAAGIQLTSNVGGKIAGVLNLTTEVLDVAPEVLAGVADGLGSVLGAGREMASRLPAAALSAVDQVESVLTAGPHVDGDLTGVLGGLKNKLSSAIANAVPEVTSLAAAVEGPVIDALPPVLQGPVQGVLTSLQTDVSGLLCQVSDVISGTAIIFNVPCGSVSSIISDTGDPGAKTSATAPLVVSATITVGEPRPLVPTPTSAISRPPLASLLSSLGSSLATAETTSASVIDPAASSALYGLSSLFSQISGLSLTATDTPSTPLLPPAVPLSPSASSGQLAETTIYHVQTITALITSTTVQVSTVTQCPADLSPGIPGGPMPAPSPSETGAGPSVTGTDTKGPCPDHGYTCDDCLDGWFCPPVQTPAWPAPCGYGWPCYHCESGWFCVPLPGDNPSSIMLASGSTSSVVTPTSHSATEGYLYAGCYVDSSTRVLGKAEILDSRGGMTNEQCVSFCQEQGLILAGTEDGAQCFCGDVLLGSALLSADHCNVTCTGDITNSTTCGGSWALSVWSPDGTAQQEPKPNSLPDAVGHYIPGGERNLPAPSHAALVVAGLQDDLSSTANSKAHGLATYQPPYTSCVSQSITSAVNTGLSSAASDLGFATATNEDLQPESSDFSFGLGHVVSDNFTAADLHKTASDEPDAAGEGSESVATGPRLALSSKIKHRGPRIRARWS